MNISGLNPSLIPQLPSLGEASGTASAGQTGDSFGSIVRNAVESLDQTQKRRGAGDSQCRHRRIADLHRTIIALQSADLSFQLGMQVRNKLIGLTRNHEDASLTRKL